MLVTVVSTVSTAKIHSNSKLSKTINFILQLILDGTFTSAELELDGMAVIVLVALTR